MTNEYLKRVYADVERRDGHEPEFLQAVREVFESLELVIDKHPEWEKAGLIERFVEPERVIEFRVPWVDDSGKVLVNRGYRMLLCDTEYDYTKEQEMVQMAAQNKVDGIIALTYNPDLKISPEVRSVSIDRYLSGSTTCVASDNYNGGRLAAQKLVENGCKSLAFLRTGSPLASETNKRRDGFVAECEAMQLPCTQKILIDGAPFSESEHFSEFEHFLEENLKDGRLAFDGIFCVTDKLAVAVIKALRRMGQRVPEDVQVIGYDGLRAFGDQDYYCSTIIQPVEAMAETCVELVLGETNPNTPSLLCLPVRYAYGGTTKA